jgi:tRNA threonylcarbamoyl adenosine modification protein YeaZ
LWLFLGLTLDAPAWAGKTSRVETVLAIAGCGPRLEIALAAPGMAAPALVALAGPTPRSELIVAAVDLLLRAADVAPGALSAVVATRGPGSFTGIRVALATAQGLAHAAGAAAHGFSSLAVQAARTEVRPCLAVQPARRGEVYAQRFDCGGAVSEPAVAALAELAVSALPVVGPAGLELPAGTPLAPATRTAAEALLALARAAGKLDPETLVPTYVERAPADAGAEKGPAWLRSRKAS